jgi:ChrR Cupin-like domain
VNSSFPHQDSAADALNILNEQDEFGQELADFQIVVGDLAYGVPLAPLSSELKDKLFARLDRLDARPTNLADLLTWSIEQLQQVATDLHNWQDFPMPIGSKWAIWQVDKLQSQLAFFLRVPTAGMLPPHWHATGESILVLEGDFIDDGIIFTAGDLFVAAANTSHQPTTSMGCLVLAVTSTNDKILAVAG